MSNALRRARRVAAVCLLAAIGAAPAAAQTSSQDPARSAVEENAPSASRATGNTTEATPRSSTRARSAEGKAMTLDAITIEGEIDVPQVLFITARDHFRDTDFLHRLYLADLAAIGREATFQGGLTVEDDRDDSVETTSTTIPKTSKE